MDHLGNKVHPDEYANPAAPSECRRHCPWPTADVKSAGPRARVELVDQAVRSFEEEFRTDAAIRLGGPRHGGCKGEVRSGHRSRLRIRISVLRAASTPSAWRLSAAQRVLWSSTSIRAWSNGSTRPWPGSIFGGSCSHWPEAGQRLRQPPNTSVSTLTSCSRVFSAPPAAAADVISAPSWSTQRSAAMPTSTGAKELTLLAGDPCAAVLVAAISGLLLAAPDAWRTLSTGQWGLRTDPRLLADAD